MAEDINKGKICSQAGYLPIPLHCVPAESLAGLQIFLAGTGGYSLYSAIDMRFEQRDSKRLLDSGVEFVYVSVKDHQVYYRTMEGALEKIVADPNIKAERKSEILYATSIELSNQLLAAPPGKEEVQRAANLARATVQLIMKDKAAFGRLCEAFNHDFYTATHLVNVCSLTISLAQKMGLVDPQVLQLLGTGGMLHDIGKIFVPAELLNSPNPLTHEEFELIRTHVDRGRQHLEKVMDVPPEMLAIIAEHHERMDGSGYPNGLKHDELSPLGRVASIVDTFDAMTAVRPYRPESYSVAEALELIEDETPDKYDAEVFHAFAAMVETSINGAGKDEADSFAARRANRTSVDMSGPKHTQLYFRIPIVVQRVRRIAGKLTLGPPEKVIAHKMSCLKLGLLSNRPFELDQNICICAPKLESIGMGKLLAVVSRCRNQGGGWYTVEAQFHKAQSAETIEKIKAVTVVREISSLTEHD